MESIYKERKCFRCGGTGRTVGVYALWEKNRRDILDNSRWVAIDYYCRKCRRKEQKQFRREYLRRKRELSEPDLYIIGGNIIDRNASLRAVRFELVKL